MYLLDLGRLNAPYKAEFLGVASKLFDDGTFIGGGLVSQFEREFAEYCGTEHCVGVGNGLDAITLALKALGIARVTKSSFRRRRSLRPGLP